MITKTTSVLDLESLHDCTLLGLDFDVSDPDERRLTLTLDSPAEMNGDRLRIRARGVFLFRCIAWGHAIGLESLNTWKDGVAPATRAELDRSRQAGLHVPASMYTICFHSGSVIELVCERLEYETEPRS
jgi:hypothetical protein